MVEKTIHSDDLIFQFITRNPAFQSEGKALDKYLSRGRESAEQLCGLILEHLERQDVSLLEFAAGYGRVTRHLKEVMPKADIVACDIHDKATMFITEKFGVTAIGSSDNPDEFSTDRDFDVVFALSFFSHMPKQTWPRWLRALVRQVKSDGILIFTTHGLQSVRLFPDYCADAEGFWFKSVSEQDDLNTSLYGSTVTTFDYVNRQIADSGARLIRFQEAMWWQHQDLYILRK